MHVEMYNFCMWCLLQLSSADLQLMKSLSFPEENVEHVFLLKLQHTNTSCYILFIYLFISLFIYLFILSNTAIVILDYCKELYFFCYKSIFSSPEHEVLMVSYCGQWLSVVRRRVSCVVCRPSTFDVYTL